MRCRTGGRRLSACRLDRGRARNETLVLDVGIGERVAFASAGPIGDVEKIRQRREKTQNDGGDESKEGHGLILT